MLIKSVVEALPQKEREIYEQMKLLPQREKELLYKLIINTDKNGVALYAQENQVILSLIRKQYISKNTAYRGEDYSFFVLAKAPHLLNALHYYSKMNNNRPTESKHGNIVSE